MASSNSGQASYANLNERVADVYKRIQNERKMIDGFRAMAAATTNQDIRTQIQAKIRDSEKSIQWFEQSLHELQKRRDYASAAGEQSGNNAPAQSQVPLMQGYVGQLDGPAPGNSGSSSYAGSSSSRAPSALSTATSVPSNNSRNRVLPPTPYNDASNGVGPARAQPRVPGPALSMRRRPNHTHLDLIKYDTPLNSAKISKMLNQLEFKLRVEKEYMQGIEKMAKLYQFEGDKKARSDAEAKRIESKGKKDLLETALKRYKTLDIMGGVFDDEDVLQGDDATGLDRKPVSGTLQIVIKSCRDLDHLPSNKRKPTETVVVVKVEDTPRARTHPSRTDRWNEEFELHVDKANEVEVTIYDKPPGNEPPTPIGMLWIRLSDLADELRRKKVGAEAGAGWVTAAGMEGDTPGTIAHMHPHPGGHAHTGSMGGSHGLDTTVAGQMQQNLQTAAARPGTAVDGIDAWFTVEPAGQIDLHLNFAKTNLRKRPFDAGGLQRQAAVRKRKEEVMEQNGHKFVQKQFYGVVLCAFCQEFLLKAAGMQCEDCRYTCHKKCYDKVVTKCISKSSNDNDGDKINHRIPHRFEPMTTLSPSWCCHCGQIVPLSRKKSRKCSECGLCCHADCAHLVPDFCGMSMEMARQLIGDIRNINKTRTTGTLPGPRYNNQVPPSPTSRLPPGSQSDAMLADGAGRMQLDPYKRVPPQIQAPPPGKQQMPPYQQQQNFSQQNIQPQQYQQQMQMQQSPGRYAPAAPQVHQQPLLAGSTSAGGQPGGDPRPQGPRQPGVGGMPPLGMPLGRVPIPQDPRNQYPLPVSAEQRPTSQNRLSYTGLPPGAMPSPQSAMYTGQIQNDLRQSQQQRPAQVPPEQQIQPQMQPQQPQQARMQPPTPQNVYELPPSGAGQAAKPTLPMPQASLPDPSSQIQQRIPPPSPSHIMQVDTRQPQHGEHRPAAQQRMSYIQQQQQQQQQAQSPASAGPTSASQQTQQRQIPSQSPVKARMSQVARKVGLDDFNFLAVLGKGNFGKVMLAEEKRSNRLWAIKVLKKEFIIENDEVESTKSEKRVFLAAARERHPFLLDLHSCFQTETRIYFVMEYISGGDLMLHIQREPFTRRRAQYYACEVLLALEYFHKQGIVYRDLKLDNILLTLDGHVKLADYGLCKENMWYGNTTSTFCGTPEFMAPEILLEKRYGRAVDWWAFGVLIYEMLLGQSPFRGDDEDEIFDAILEDEPLYPIHMPRASVSILQQLLIRDPEQRLGAGPNDADDIKAHIFFKGISWDDVFHKRIPAPYFPTIKGPLDTSNFDQEFTREQPTLTPVHSQLSAADQREFASFSWVGPAAMGA